MTVNRAPIYVGIDEIFEFLGNHQNGDKIMYVGRYSTDSDMITLNEERFPKQLPDPLRPFLMETAFEGVLTQPYAYLVTNNRWYHLSFSQKQGIAIGVLGLYSSQLMDGNLGTILVDGNLDQETKNIAGRILQTSSPSAQIIGANQGDEKIPILKQAHHYATLLHHYYFNPKVNPKPPNLIRVNVEHYFDFL